MNIQRTTRVLAQAVLLTLAPLMCGCAHSDLQFVLRLQETRRTPDFSFATLNIPGNDKKFFLILASESHELIDVIGPFNDGHLQGIHANSEGEALVTVSYVRARGSGFMYRRQQFNLVDRRGARSVLDLPLSGYITGWGGDNEAAFEVIAKSDQNKHAIDIRLVESFNGSPVVERAWRYKWSNDSQSYQCTIANNETELEQEVERILARQSVPGDSR